MPLDVAAFAFSCIFLIGFESVARRTASDFIVSYDDVETSLRGNLTTQFWLLLEVMSVLLISHWALGQIRTTYPDRPSPYPVPSFLILGFLGLTIFNNYLQFRAYLTRGLIHSSATTFAAHTITANVYEENFRSKAPIVAGIIDRDIKAVGVLLGGCRTQLAVKRVLKFTDVRRYVTDEEWAKYKFRRWFNKLCVQSIGMNLLVFHAISFFLLALIQLDEPLRIIRSVAIDVENDFGLKYGLWVIAALPLVVVTLCYYQTVAREIERQALVVTEAGTMCLLYRNGLSAEAPELWHQRGGNSALVVCQILFSIAMMALANYSPWDDLTWARVCFCTWVIVENALFALLIVLLSVSSDRTKIVTDIVQHAEKALLSMQGKLQ